MAPEGCRQRADPPPPFKTPTPHSLTQTTQSAPRHRARRRVGDRPNAPPPPPLRAPPPPPPLPPPGPNPIGTDPRSIPQWNGIPQPLACSPSPASSAPGPDPDPSVGKRVRPDRGPWFVPPGGGIHRRGAAGGSRAGPLPLPLRRCGQEPSARPPLPCGQPPPGIEPTCTVRSLQAGQGTGPQPLGTGVSTGPEGPDRLQEQDPGPVRAPGRTITFAPNRSSSLSGFLSEQRPSRPLVKRSGERLHPIRLHWAPPCAVCAPPETCRPTETRRLFM